MFKCYCCHRSVGPRIGQVKVTDLVPSTYTNVVKVVDEFGKESEKVVESVGTEIAREVAFCPSCAGDPNGGKPKPRVDGFHMPDEKLAPTFKNSIIRQGMERLLENCHIMETRDRTSQRMKRDTQNTLSMIKIYADRGGKL